ncbi:MAG: FAD-dependent oxidoreductase [Bacillota bacterium]
MPRRVIVTGGGWAGCAAALSAARAGAEVHLYEKTDMLLGAGLVGGIMRNNGRYSAAEEALRLGGGGELFALTDQAARHRNIRFPGHEHANLYDITLIEPLVLDHLKDAGVNVRLSRRVVDVRREGDRLTAVVDEDGRIERADAFVDTTGTSGPMGNCMRYGNGCVMCIQRCPAFGPRVSLVARAGVAERMALKRPDVPGAMSGSGKLNKDSLSREVRGALEESGVAVLPLPREMIHREKLGGKACQQYALPEYADNIVLLDTGHAKLMTPYFPLSDLRQIPGLERARFEDPYAGGKGNSIRFTAIAPRDDHLLVDGLSNLFCAGEKAGIYIGHTEAIVTGTLAGHNAARCTGNLELVELPRSTAVGDFIAYGREEMLTRRGLEKSYTFAGSVFFDRMQSRGLYTTDGEVLDRRVNETGLSGAFSRSL